MSNIYRNTILLIIGILAFSFLGIPFVSADASGAFTFAVFGDNSPRRPIVTQPENFKKVLTAINSHKPDFAFNTGDCIYGSAKLPRVEAQYKGYTDTVKSLLDAKVYLTIGNHEVNGGKAAQDFFKEEVVNLYYSFNYGNSHFIVLDSDLLGQQSRITGEQLSWLKEDLDDSRAARHKFVFVHRPLFPVNGHKGKCLDMYPDDRDALHKLFVRNRITAVFMGHEHLFHEEVRNGVRYIITGGAGAFLYPSINGGGDFNHFVLTSVDGDKVTMKMCKIAQRGKQTETFQITD